MIGCCSPHVAVDCTENSMTVVVGDKICSITAGDNVSVTETDHSWIIDVNGELTEIPKMPEVDVEMTEECYNITVGDRSICIPRCRSYNDCEGNELPNCARLVTCEQLEELVDDLVTCYNPADFTITNEIRNGEVVRCLNLNDIEIDVCGAPEVPTIVDGDTILLCRNGNVRRVQPDELIPDMCFNSVPDLGTICATGEQLVLYMDNGCRRLGRVSTASLSSMVSTMSDVWSHLPANTSGYVVPDDFVNPTNYYSLADYVSDGGIDHLPYNGGEFGNFRRAAPSMNNSRIVNSRIAAFSGELACSRTFDVSFVVARSGTFADYAEADGARALIAYRVRFRPNAAAAWSPWLYSFTQGSGTLSTAGGPFNGVAPTVTNEHLVTLYAGLYELEYFYIASAANPLKFSANTFVASYGPPQPRFTLTPRLV